ncbi:MAG: 50S ribosomal protein L21 [Gammaproteobacteria bacterium]|nr:50S ribosomal protein L21 [Gammaproteobacteria bacterium]
MYAVVQSGGKQYRVAVGDVLKVESLQAEPGASVDLEKVLLVADGDKLEVGAPYLEGTKVTATVRAHGRAPKIHIMRFRRRKNSRTRTGHRQNFTELEITAIGGKGAKKAAAKKAAQPDEE